MLFRSSSCCKKGEEAHLEELKEEEVAEAPMLTQRIKKKIQTSENYINSFEWRENDVPARAMRLVHENIDNPEEYEKIKNTCVKLLELFAMKASRRDEISRVRDRIMQVDSDLAEEIDMSKFSQCAFYEGRILLYR